MEKDTLNQQFEQKVKRGIFRPVARHVRGDRAETEDRMQDAVCSTWQLFHRNATKKGKFLPDPILIQFCRWRATDLGHSFVPAGCHRRRDVYNQTAYQAGEVEVLRIDGIFAEALAPSPERKLNSAIDLEDWLHGLSRTDRNLMLGKFQGFTLGDLSSELGLTYSAVWVRAKMLGVELAVRAGVTSYGASKRQRERKPRDLDASMRDAEAVLAAG